jgi:signal transduction histidine kinase
MRWLEHRAVPVSLEESTVRVVEMITDVTAQEESQQRLARANTLALTGELAATVVHEVRNAATSTKLLLQLWAEREPPDSKHGASLSAAMASVARMEVLAENLLRIGRRPDRDWRECDLVQLVRGAVELIRPETYRRNITLVLDSPGDPLPCRADSGMLTAALLNLLLNATQAMTDLPGGRRRQLSISVGSDVLAEDFQDAREYPYGPDFVDHAGDLNSQLRHGSPVVFVEVKDTGAGISTEDRQRVFEPFYTTKPSGTGLGLPITSRILKQHGGTLLLTSEPGVGSCFRVVLPACTDGARYAPPSLPGS